jgi:hypothetical protein
MAHCRPRRVTCHVSNRRKQTFQARSGVSPTRALALSPRREERPSWFNGLSTTMQPKRKRRRAKYAEISGAARARAVAVGTRSFFALGPEGSPSSCGGRLCVFRCGPVLPQRPGACAYPGPPYAWGGGIVLACSVKRCLPVPREADADDYRSKRSNPECIVHSARRRHGTPPVAGVAVQHHDKRQRQPKHMDHRTSGQSGIRPGQAPAARPPGCRRRWRRRAYRRWS